MKKKEMRNRKKRKRGKERKGCLSSEWRSELEKENGKYSLLSRKYWDRKHEGIEGKKDT